MDKSLIEKIEGLVAPLLDQAQVELVDLSIRREYGSVVVQILADKPCGGITLEECSLLNRKIADALESENILANRYIVEVCSPGLDRPLCMAKDFARVINRPVRVFLSEAVDNKLEYDGIIKQVNESSITLESDSAKAVIIPLTKINKAKQII